MAVRVFIDTNIWLYGLTLPTDGKDCEKRQKTLDLLAKLTKETLILVSTQVINEFHWNMTKKFNLQDKAALELVLENIEPITIITDLGYSIYHKAFDLRSCYSLSFWDSLIVASALDASCETLYTEDMQHGLVIRNQIKIVNPLV